MMFANCKLILLCVVELVSEQSCCVRSTISKQRMEVICEDEMKLCCFIHCEFPLHVNIYKTQSLILLIKIFFRYNTEMVLKQNLFSYVINSPFAFEFIKYIMYSDNDQE